MMNSAAKTIAGAAALDGARTALAPFAELYTQIATIQNSNVAAARILPAKISPATPAPTDTSFESPNHTRKRASAPTYAEIAANGIEAQVNNARRIVRHRPDRANRQAAALFSVPDPGRIVFIRLRFSGFNQTAPISNMAILRHALADADYRGSSVLIALQDSSILVGLRKNTIESFEKALSKVVASFSNAIPQLAFDIQPDFMWFTQDAPPALQPTAIRGAVAKELDRLSTVATTWKARPHFENALRVFAGLPHSVPYPHTRGNLNVPTTPSVPFTRKRVVQQDPENPSPDGLGPPTHHVPESPIQKETNAEQVIQQTA